MKFIHISDLHFGKLLFGYSLVDEGDQKYWVDEFLKLVKREEVDAICMAGDIYDRSVPSKEAVLLFDYFITKLADLKIPVFMIAGNHDSAIRLEFGANIFKYNNIYIAGEVRKDIVNITLKDEFGDVTFWLVPYLFPAAVAKVLEDDSINTYDIAFNRLISAQNIDYTKRNVIVSHQTVFNFGESLILEGSETAIGGVGNISVDLYDKFDYVALGHIHAAQKVKYEHIRYCGSILNYHFGELKKANKGPVIVTLKEKGDFSYRIAHLPILHPLREIRGRLCEILEKESKNDCVNEYIRVELTDDSIPNGARDMLRFLFEEKNSRLLEIVHKPINHKITNHDYSRDEIKSIDDYFVAFYQARNDEEYPSMNDQELISFISNQVINADNEDKVNEPSTKDIDDIISFVLGQEK